LRESKQKKKALPLSRLRGSDFQDFARVDALPAVADFCAAERLAPRVRLCDLAGAPASTVAV